MSEIMSREELVDLKDREPTADEIAGMAMKGS